MDSKRIAELRELRNAASGPNGVHAAVEYQRKLNEVLPELLDAYNDAAKAEQEAIEWEADYVEEMQKVAAMQEQLQVLADENAELQADLEASQGREERLQEPLNWFILQLFQEPCQHDAEGSDETTGCTETGACITEYCLPCYARTVKKMLKGSDSDV